MTDSQTLLAQYVAEGSEGAFRELVARYLDLVYSSARRLVNGDAHLAQDVAQTVFVDLARLARTLPRQVMLGGWLHRHTCFVAACDGTRLVWQNASAPRPSPPEAPLFVPVRLLGPMQTEELHAVGNGNGDGPAAPIIHHARWIRFPA